MSLRNTFSTTISDIGRNSTIYVESLNAFPEPVGSTITLLDGVRYILTKPINTGTLQFIIPAAGEVVFGTSNELKNVWTTELTSDNPLFSGDVQRLIFRQINIINTTGTGNLFDIEVITASRSVMSMDEMQIIGFADLGTIDGTFSIMENILFSGNGAGLKLVNNGTVAGTGIIWDSVNFVQQTGDHIIASGTSSIATFSRIGGFPSTGDRLFNLDALTVSGTLNVVEPTFSAVFGGSLGLQQTFSSNTVMNNKAMDVELDSSGGAFTVTLPDITASLFPEGREIQFTDLGDASANNITLLPNPNDGTTINLLSQFIIDTDGQAIVLKQVDGQWIIIGNSATYVVVGLMAMISNNTVTTIDSIGVYEDIAGTIVAGTNNERFTFSTDTLTYTGVRSIKAAVDVSIFLQREMAAASRVMKFGLFVNDALEQELEVTMSSDITNASFTTVIPLVTDDEVKMKVQNTEDTANVIITTYDFRILRVSDA